MDRHIGVNNVKMYVQDFVALLRWGRDIFVWSVII